MGATTTIDRTNCAATRHGTINAYQRHHCRCDDARHDTYLYYKHARNGLPYRRRIDATGTRRRVQALYAHGHTGHTIAAHSGLHTRQIQQLGAPAGRRWVTPDTATAVTRAYQQLATQPGTSDDTRRRAAASGYLPPHVWGDDIDDPTANPAAPTDPDHVDEVLVARALAGDTTAARALTKAERAEAVHIGRRRGLAPTTLAELLGANNRTINALAATTAA